MRITVALAFWNESPADLAACVIGAANIADRIVAVDGAYKRWPGATISSPPEQADVIRGTALAMGMECVIHVPDRLWAGQVEKRTFLMQQAALDSDWIAVLDTDHLITADRKAARAELASYGSEVDVVRVPFFTPSGERAATNWHAGMAGKTIEIGHFFRALPDFSVDGFHWHYSARKGDQRVQMYYGVPGGSGRLLQAPYVIEHRSLHRDEAHTLANRAFCNDRIKVVALTGQEDDLPELPEPGSAGWEWNYVTVPY